MLFLMESFLEVHNVKKYFFDHRGLLEMVFGGMAPPVRAVDGVSFQIRRGRMRRALWASPDAGRRPSPASILRIYELTEGEIWFEGRNVQTLDRSELKRLYQRVQIIFQDPRTSLDPRMKVEQIIGEPLEIHGRGSRLEKKEKVLELLSLTGLSPGHANRFPHEFSGGQQQRIAIARALAIDPAFVICDEPVSALDVSIQGQILNLLMDLQEKFQLSYLFITHDLSVARHICNRIGVMYLGKIMEFGDTDDIFAAPASSLHAGAPFGGPPPGAGSGLAADPVAGRAPGPPASASRVPLQRPLPGSHPRMPGGRAGAEGMGKGACGGVPPPGK